jgi:hypothetical protein
MSEIGAVPDKLGQEITAGSFVVYGHALGRCAGLRIGKVLSIIAYPEARRKDERFRIRVRGIDDDCGSCQSKACETDGILKFPDRIVVLDDAIVPTLYRKLLEGY